MGGKFLPSKKERTESKPIYTDANNPLRYMYKTLNLKQG